MEDSERVGRSVSCAFTGHRPEGLPWGEAEEDPRCLALKARLDKTLEAAYDVGYRHFLCGMAKGADFYFCEAVLRLRRTRPDIRLEAAVPFPEQSQGWRGADRERYQVLLKQCDLETVVQRFHSPGCMQRRNRYMVDHASRLIAVYNGRPTASGTLYTIHYAMQKGLPVDLLEV